MLSLLIDVAPDPTEAPTNLPGGSGDGGGGIDPAIIALIVGAVALVAFVFLLIRSRQSGSSHSV